MGETDRGELGQRGPGTRGEVPIGRQAAGRSLCPWPLAELVPVRAQTVGNRAVLENRQGPGATEAPLGRTCLSPHALTLVLRWQLLATSLSLHCLLVISPRDISETSSSGNLQCPLMASRSFRIHGLLVDGKPLGDRASRDRCTVVSLPGTVPRKRSHPSTRPSVHPSTHPSIRRQDWSSGLGVLTAVLEPLAHCRAKGAKS